MGREAFAACRWNGQAGEVKALLESRELILRGALKACFAIADMSDIGVEGDDLRFRAGEHDVALTLGAPLAASWARKLATPPPTLAQKLGIGPSARALLIGETHEPVLLAALAGGRAGSPQEARLSLAIVGSEADLLQALSVHDNLPPGMPIWIVHGKGPRTAFGEGPVRLIMREAGYRDNKVSAVSDALSATRYARSKM